jgi:hypothetical protein
VPGFVREEEYSSGRPQRFRDAAFEGDQSFLTGAIAWLFFVFGYG